MANNNPPNPGKADPKDSPKYPGAAAETELNNRIGNLQAEIKELERELRVDRGRIANRDPAVSHALQRENKELRARMALLEKALLAMVQDVYKPRHVADERLQFEVLRQTAIDFCKQHNIDPEIWKSLES